MNKSPKINSIVLLSSVLTSSAFANLTVNIFENSNGLNFQSSGGTLIGPSGITGTGPGFNATRSDLLGFSEASNGRGQLGILGPTSSAIIDYESSTPFFTIDSSFDRFFIGQFQTVTQGAPFALTWIDRDAIPSSLGVGQNLRLSDGPIAPFLMSTVDESLSSLGLTEGDFFTIAWDNSFVTFVVAEFLDLQSLSATTTSNFQLARLSPQTTVNGAHHRLLMDSALNESGVQYWLTGDYADFDDFDATQKVAEIGIATDFNIENFRVGLGLGKTSVDQDTAFGGDTELDGEFALVEANYKLPEKNVILSSLFYYGAYDLDSTRGYSGGGATSRGSTDTESIAIRLRADFKDVYTYNKFSVTPRVSYTYLHTDVDGYTETGGLSPATINSSDSDDHEFRVGTDIDYNLSEQTQFRGIVELVYRDADDVSVSGSSGAASFTLPVSNDVNDVWARFGIETVHQFTDNMAINASIFRSTEGFDATWSGAIGLTASF